MESTLTNQFLIATPKLDDAIFGRSIIYIFEHNINGAAGFIINKKVKHFSHDMLFQGLNLKFDSSINLPIHLGGPVDAQKGFIIHSNESNYKLDENKPPLQVSSNLEILQDIARGKGPKKNMFVFGYASWNKGQLENEIKEDSWIIIKGDSGFVFDGRAEYKWQNTFESMSIDVENYSSIVGHC